MFCLFKILKTSCFFRNKLRKNHDIFGKVRLRIAAKTAAIRENLCGFYPV